jgi:hypothetical protein
MKSSIKVVDVVRNDDRFQHASNRNTVGRDTPTLRAMAAIFSPRP